MAVCNRERLRGDAFASEWDTSSCVDMSAPFEQQQRVHLAQVGDALVADSNHLNRILQCRVEPVQLAVLRAILIQHVLRTW